MDSDGLPIVGPGIDLTKVFCLFPTKNIHAPFLAGTWVDSKINGGHEDKRFLE